MLVTGFFKYFRMAVAVVCFFVSLKTFARDIILPTSPRVMSIDWTQTETMLALGLNPVASAQQVDYNAWVSYPKLHDSMIDVGLRTQPNLEILSELDLDTIFISTQFKSLRSQLSRVTKVESIPLYTDGDISWNKLKIFTRTMADLTENKALADIVINDAEQTFAELKKHLPDNLPPLIIIQFMDSHYVRVFGQNSLYGIAISQLGLKSAWGEKTNSWGFALIGIDRLQGIEGRLVVVEPLPAGVDKHLVTDQFWQYLVMQSGNPVLRVSAVWSFGAIPSSVRFARLITQAFEQEVTQ